MKGKAIEGGKRFYFVVVEKPSKVQPCEAWHHDFGASPAVQLVGLVDRDAEQVPGVLAVEGRSYGALDPKEVIEEGGHEIVMEIKA